MEKLKQKILSIKLSDDTVADGESPVFAMNEGFDKNDFNNAIQ